MLQKFALSFSSSTTSHPLISSWGFSLLRHSLPPAFLVSHPISPPFITSFIFLCFLFSFWPCSDNRQKLISWTHEQARRGDEVVHERAKEWPVVAQRSKPLKLWLAEKALINSIFTFIYSRTRWVTLFLFPLMTPSLALIHDSFLPPTRNIASATTLESPLPPLSLSLGLNYVIYNPDINQEHAHSSFPLVVPECCPSGTLNFPRQSCPTSSLRNFQLLGYQAHSAFNVCRWHPILALVKLRSLVDDEGSENSANSDH